MYIKQSKNCMDKNDICIHLNLIKKQINKWRQQHMIIIIGSHFSPNGSSQTLPNKHFVCLHVARISIVVHRVFFFYVPYLKMGH